ncbi:MAG: tRNA 2-thiouridine(34) synthase MnmA [Endomicrobiia bacterium]|nr:tRNA 2-thiouridine(34) synthase MnmA [Endomicrobiia bacterium]
MKPRVKKVLVAMSGGVDSSVAALLMVRAGHDVVGATMKLWNASDDKKRHGGCCSLDDISDAAKVCRTLGIRHYVFNFEEIFKSEVADSFAREYLRGRTPNPCVVCNETVKFGALLDKSASLGFDCLATGHYANVISVRNNDAKKTFLVGKAADLSKDQSYFLWRVPPERLASVVFPAGDLKKQDVRRIAAANDLPVARKKESRDACFAGGDYKDFVAGVCRRHKSEESAADGVIADEDGNILGRHDGIFRFTVGQRSGLGIASKERLYVLRIEPSENRVIVGPRERALAEKFLVSDWVLRPPYEKLPAEYGVKIRYLSMEVSACVRRQGDDLAVELGAPVFGVTPGQSAVFYRRDKVVGGGVIKNL